MIIKVLNNTLVLQWHRVKVFKLPYTGYFQGLPRGSSQLSVQVWTCTTGRSCSVGPVALLQQSVPAAAQVLTLAHAAPAQMQSSHNSSAMWLSTGQHFLNQLGAEWYLNAEVEKGE